MGISKLVLIVLSLSLEIESIWLDAKGQDVDIIEQFVVVGLRDISLFLHGMTRRPFGGDHGAGAPTLQRPCSAPTCS